ncbi:TetR/AcrR family transcriptional regulator [uncultured Microbulbifer sp.]|uniref:TetR/AcrR family transcriptional regulator n=1 Tax=uncultured Microbulbifer sp. TaxID=348147 RepID=UPI0026391EBF|nr:TetR/AcrR family transcriptional regulator [uncultured Microbulbifer sp.]
MTVDNGKSDLVYHGRRAQRADSRLRRKAILEATLRLIVKEGIRGIRHRAVAREANVPLAATTYYFKDLNDLISDSFTYFVEQGLESTRQLQEESFSAARNLSAQERASSSSHKLLVQQLARFILTHVRNQAEDRDRRLVELAFRNEALRNEQLTRAVRMSNHARESLIQEFFHLLGITDAEAAAQIAHGTILKLEYEILSSSIALDSPLLERTVTMMVRGLIPATATQIAESAAYG